MKIAVRGGHCPNVPGAKGILDELTEDRKVKESVVKYLKQLNHDVLDVTPPNSTSTSSEDLYYGVNKANNWGANLFISIHLNYYESPSVYGPMVYYQKNNDSSKLLANLIQNGLNMFTDTNKITHSGDYYLLNKTNVTGVIVECGFLSNIEERNKLMDSSYQYGLAKTIYDSVREYLM